MTAVGPRAAPTTGRQARVRARERRDAITFGSQVGPPEIVDPSPPRWRLPLALVGVALVAMFATWAQIDRLGAARSGAELPRIEVPDVSELDMAEARARLEELSFVVHVEYQPNEDPAKPKGMTFGQEPGPGSKVAQGDVVTIIVSDGPAGLTVPDVVAQQVVDAQAVLGANGLRSIVREVTNEFAPVGEVIGTDPEAGGRVPLDGLVTLTVSTGPAPRTVPDMVGKDLASALVELGRSGLNIGDIVREHRPGQPEGLVLASSPAAGAQLPRSMPVGLTVTGPPPRSTVPSIVGLSQSSATSLLTRADLTPEPLAREVPPGDPQVGRVLSQNIPPFGEVPAGTTVQFVVGVAAAPTTTTTAVPPAPPAPPPGG